MCPVTALVTGRQMSGKKTGREGRAAGRATKARPVARGRDSEDAESETSAMSGTSSEKRHLAQTRAALREAGEDALRYGCCSRDSD